MTLRIRSLEPGRDVLGPRRHPLFRRGPAHPSRIRAVAPIPGAPTIELLYYEYGDQTAHGVRVPNHYALLLPLGKPPPGWATPRIEIIRGCAADGSTVSHDAWVPKPDNHCFYRCIARALGRRYMHIRRAAASYVAKHACDFDNFITHPDRVCWFAVLRYAAVGGGCRYAAVGYVALC